MRKCPEQWDIITTRTSSWRLLESGMCTGSSVISRACWASPPQRSRPWSPGTPAPRRWWPSVETLMWIVFLCICYLLWSQNIVPSSLSGSDDALQLEPKIVQNIMYLYFTYISLGIHSDKALVIKNSFQNFYSLSILKHDICRRSCIKQDQEIFKSWFNGIWCPPASVYK